MTIVLNDVIKKFMVFLR